MTTSSRLPAATSAPDLGCQALPLLCWRCRGEVALLGGEERERVAHHHCDHCGAITIRRSGIWRCIAPGQLQRYESFIREYESIRSAEGRGSCDPAYYLALPYQDLSRRMTAQWAIRARTFETMERKIVRPVAARQARPLHVLDLGAGNGWLSYRLALAGHAPIAVDMLTNTTDGLGASAHYASHLPAMFPRVQAVVDQLPFPSSSFDLAIFNASFHYSQNYQETLAEALRCLRPGGLIVTADTPWYAHERSGEAMVREKHARFRALYGFPSASIPSQEFLTPQRLNALAGAFHLRWLTFSPFYGISWSLRPMRALLSEGRMPSQFRIYAAEKPSTGVGA